MSNYVLTEHIGINLPVLFRLTASCIFVTMYIKKTSPSPNCGLDLAGEVMYGKWKFRILWFIHQGNKRSSELKRMMPDASSRILNIQLRELKEHELVNRTIYPVMPPKVEYTLTDFGKTLIPLLSSIGTWAEVHQEHLTKVILQNIPNSFDRLRLSTSRRI